MTSVQCSNDNLDVVFLVDGSGSVGVAGFEEIKTFLALLVSQLNFGGNHTSVGVNQFSSWTSEEMPLNRYTSGKEMARAIKRIPYHNSGTSIGEAIQHAVRDSFAREKGDRPCSQDVLIVITDGKDNGDLGIETAVAEAACRRILTVAVGIGPNVVDEELLAIAAGDRRRVFKVDNVQSLFSLQDHFCDAIEGLNPCDSNPCSAFGTCYQTADASFECICTPGYTGSLCETDIDECISSPCENDGTCNNLINSYSCDCENQYHGIKCQFEDGGCPCWLIYLLGSLLIIACLTIAILLLYFCRKKKFRHKITQTDFTPPPTPKPVVVYEVVVKEPEVVKPEPENHILPPLDFLAVVDNSGSVGNSNFKRVRTFLTKFIQHMTLAPEEDGPPTNLDHCSLFGLILFNRQSRLGVPLGMYTRGTLSKLIETLPYEGHSTNLGEALLHAAKTLGAKYHPARSKIPKVVLVVSDGFSDDDVRKGSAALQSMGVLVLVVGVRKFNKETLDVVVNHKTERIFFVVDFDSMKSWLRLNLVQEISKALDEKETGKKNTGHRKRRSRSSIAPK